MIAQGGESAIMAALRSGSQRPETTGPVVTLQDAFTNTLKLPPDAAQWLLDVWACIQLLDDATDGDPAQDVGKVVWAVFVGMPSNPFWQAKQAALMPALVLCILKWEAANKAEANGVADARSFMWRAGYYDLVTLVAYLCHGPFDASAALSLYGESLYDYLTEFADA